MPRVSLFVTCIVDQVFPQVGLAMAGAIEHAGCEIEFREAQTCCGQPAFNSGYRREARTVAEYFLRVFEDADYIVVPSGSCASMIAHHYAELFDAGDTRIAGLASRVWEFSRFLVDVLHVEDVGARLERVATYHDGCHALREMRTKEAPRRLLEHVRGLRLAEMDAAEECCGFGGTFSVKFPEVSGGMARTKIDSILRSGAEIVVSTDSSCLMQIQGVLSRAGVGVRTMHLAEVLDSR